MYDEIKKLYRLIAKGTPIKPKHQSIYMYLVFKREEIDYDPAKIAHATGISSKNTITSSVTELVNWGLIIYKKGVNQTQKGTLRVNRQGQKKPAHIRPEVFAGTDTTNSQKPVIKTCKIGEWIDKKCGEFASKLEAMNMNQSWPEGRAEKEFKDFLGMIYGTDKQDKDPTDLWFWFYNKMKKKGFRLNESSTVKIHSGFKAGTYTAK